MVSDQTIIRHNVEIIRNGLVGAGRFSRGKIHYFDDLDSTNAWLQAQGDVDGCICLAENQSAGRGRQGKSWQNSRYGSILLSLGWRLQRPDISGLSLVSGLAVVDSLRTYGVRQLALKWPNDILLDGKKVGGILVEISAQNCVIGIGLNLRMCDSMSARIDQPWVDLASMGYRLDRDQLVVELVRQHDRALTDYTDRGFAGFADRWNRLNAHRGQRVEVVSGKKVTGGVVCGVDQTGALMLNHNGATCRVIAGEVSLQSVGGQNQAIKKS